jgi:hypothetical protein
MRFDHEFRESFKLGGGAVVREFCHAINGGSSQITRDRDHANVIF